MAHSDLPLEDLVAAKTQDDDDNALLSLMALARQIGPLQRLPSRLAVQDLLWATLEARAHDVGSQLPS
jgi:hypothetical protein